MTCLIVDDEPLAREAMRALVEEAGEITISGSFNTAEKAAKYLENNHVDLVFLDIEMPGCSGLEFARHVKDEVLIIFTTAYSNYALESYEVNAIDYLVKPVSFPKFSKAVTRASEYLKLLSGRKDTIADITADFLFIKAERRYYKIEFEDIQFIEALKDYVIVHTREEKIITAQNLKTIHAQLPAAVFIRVSKSYVANTRHINSFNQDTIYIGEYELPLGKVFKKDFYQQYLGRDWIA